MILSANMLVMLTAQYSYETRNSLIYTMLQSWADMRGLTGTAKFMRSQAKGERGHADMVLNYIHDRNEQLAGVDIVPFEGPPESFAAVLASVQATERATTEQIRAILEQANAEGDMATCAWLNQPGGLVLEQVEEEATIQTILDRLAARRGMVSLDEGEINQAEMPGEVIHDMDRWIGKLA